MSKHSSLYIGIMSGTSSDGADAVIADFSASQPRVLGYANAPFPDTLRAEILALNSAGGNEIERSHIAANLLAAIYSRVALQCLAQADVASHDVAAIGCHGQTVRHRPDLGFTTQLNNPSLLAELTGIDVIADFRSRDIAAGGQGAPLVPAFHDAVFRSPHQARAIVNIGGIANLTILEPTTPTRGFDCGLGNCLMDDWIRVHLNQPYDHDGNWAATGQVNVALLNRLQDDGYFSAAPPKSAGRDHFHLVWLGERLRGGEATADVQATLLALTAWSIADHLARYAATTQRLLVCGGGSFNPPLMAALAALLPSVMVEKTDTHGVPAMQVEALAFAWLAYKSSRRERIDLTPTTGARQALIYGATYPA